MSIENPRNKPGQGGPTGMSYDCRMDGKAGASNARHEACAWGQCECAHHATQEFVDGHWQEGPPAESEPEPEAPSAPEPTPEQEALALELADRIEAANAYLNEMRARRDVNIHAMLARKVPNRVVASLHRIKPSRVQQIKDEAVRMAGASS